MAKTTTCKTRKATGGTKKASTCKPRKTRKARVSKTDGLSNLDMGESHVITDDEVDAIINEDVKVEKKASEEKPEDKKEINPLQNLSPYEFQVTISVLPGVQNAKQIIKQLEEDLKDNKDEGVAQKIEVLKELNTRAEMGIWNSMAKKFGYNSLDEAQAAGIKLTIKSGHFVQAVDA